jgi:hypothetical protein
VERLDLLTLEQAGVPASTACSDRFQRAEDARDESTGTTVGGRGASGSSLGSIALTAASRRCARSATSLIVGRLVTERAASP